MVCSGGPGPVIPAPLKVKNCIVFQIFRSHQCQGSFSVFLALSKTSSFLFKFFITSELFVPFGPRSNFWGSEIAKKRCEHRCVMIRVCGVKCCIRRLVVLLVGLLVVLSSGLILFCRLIGIPLARKKQKLIPIYNLFVFSSEGNANQHTKPNKPTG